MSNTVRTQNKKEAFIVDTLLTYYLGRIESEENSMKRTTLQKQIATMLIFPYLTEEGNRYGALREPGIRWYYTEDRNTDRTYSTESYRILNKAVLKEGQLLNRLKHVFGTDGCGYIQKFSNDAVIEDLISQMSKEGDYTAYWWRCATDAFDLWNPQSDPGNTYAKATKGIMTSYMLYDDEYCEPEYQRLLEKYRVFLDIRKTDAFKDFMGHVSKARTKDALRFLKYLGIPHKFAMESSWDKCLIDARITKLFIKSNTLPYPVLKTMPTNYELCRLTEYLYFQVFWRSHTQIALDLYKNQETVGGIFLRNVQDEYMPLRVSMFYLSDKYIQERQEELPVNRLNMFLIKPTAYSIDRLKQVAYSTDDIDCFEAYRFGSVGVKALPFYKWAWQFTQNKELVGNILKLLTVMKNIGQAHEEFVLDVLNKICETNYSGDVEISQIASGSSFTADVSGDNALGYALSINALYYDRNTNVFMVISEGVVQEGLDIKYRILQEIDAQHSSTDARRIEQAEFWDNIWLLNNPKDDDAYYGKYVNVLIKTPKMGVRRNCILLSRENDANSYIEAVCAYIEDVYGISLEGVTSDWKAEYYQLVHGVNDFLCDYRETIPEEEIQFNESVMSDVDSMEDEYRIWKRFNKEKDSILGNRVSEVDLNSWRAFLDSKYHGRCQLCDSRTVSGVQNAYFWTYRIMKEKANGGNGLANLHSNIFCLCPSCHGELSRPFMGKDMHQVKDKAMEYLQQLNEAMSDDLEDLSETDSVVSMFADTVNKYDGFRAPIICNVIVNGAKRQMKFSWEHFMRIAFLLSGLDDQESDE